jgi:hypothetical protein
MVTVVITINMLIASGCLYVAWQVWKLRIALSRAADGLIAAERATAQVLSGAPQGIGRGETGVYQLRQQYQQLEIKLQRVQQILKLLGLGQLVWQWYGRKLPNQLPKPLSSTAQLHKVAHAKARKTAS